MINNNNLIWWTGVVEDRKDPEKLGRCRVRIFGYHTEDVNILPTEDLPWALPLQSITSAAISGIGTSPVGIVPGSWVMGWFIDGEDAQQPVIIGTLAGKPSSSVYTEQKQQEIFENNNSVLRSSDGRAVLDGSGNPIRTSYESTDLRERFDSLNPAQVDNVKNVLGKTLSDNDYAKIGIDGKVGKYQFSIEQLVSEGYIARPPGKDYAFLDNDNFWLGKNDISSKEDFLKNQAIQEELALNVLNKNYNELVSLGKLKPQNEDPYILAGLLSSSFVSDPVTSDKFNKKLPDGTSLKTFFETGVAAISSDAEKDYYQGNEQESSYLPDSDSLDEYRKRIGFQDPNKRYPTQEYSNNDINKLSLGDRSHRLFKTKTNKKITKIEKARTSETWDEPEPAFGAAYPFNQVIETEAGHVIELDSTDGAERIHVYHKEGTYIEIDVNGSMVRKVVGDDYEILDKNNSLYVGGSHSITVEGRSQILVKNDAFIEVDGGLSVTGHNDIAVQAAGTIAVLSDKLQFFGKNGIDIASQGPIKMKGTSVGIESTEGSITINSKSNIFNNCVDRYTIGAQAKVEIIGGTGLDMRTKSSSLNMDAAAINMRMNLSAQNYATTPALTPKEFDTLPEKLTPEPTSIEPPQRNAEGQDTFDLDDATEEADTEQYRKDRNLPSDSVAALPKNANQGNSYNRSTITPGTIGNCAQFRQLVDFPDSLPLSKNYVLRDFVNPKYDLKDQSGLTRGEIVCNLQNLAQNILEPLRRKYSNRVIITSGLRNINDKYPNAKSDHLRGCAVDLQFKDAKLSEYPQIAEWMLANLPYKQFLLEYATDGDGKIKLAWIHISLEISSSGALIPTGKTPVGTVVNHKMAHANRIVNLA